MGQVAWVHEVDVTDWDQQVKAFEAAIAEFGRIDYVYPIAGIGERVWTPNRPNATGFTKPDLAVLDADVIGVLYTVSLALQQFRRQEPSKRGFRGKSKRASILTDSKDARLMLAVSSRMRGLGMWVLLCSHAAHIHSRKTVSNGNLRMTRTTDLSPAPSLVSPAHLANICRKKRSL